jgi:hypothetical protein
MKTVLAAALFLGIVFGAAPVEAHRVNCFAAVEGDMISGYAWMGGGVRPKNVPYKVLSPDGTVLHRGTTNENGEFSFTPLYACDHEIVVEAGEGHVARFVVREDELPASADEILTGHTDAGVPGRKSSGGKAAPADTGSPVMAGNERDELEKAVARAVNKEIAPLRRDLAEFQERERLQDFVAGLGFIAGLAGAAFFFLGARRKNPQ